MNALRKARGILKQPALPVTTSGNPALRRLRHGQPLQFRQVFQGLFAAAAAHFRRGRQRTAHRRTLRRTEEPAAELPIQVHARHSCRLALRHPRDRRRNRGGDAAGTTTGTAFENLFHTITVSIIPKVNAMETIALQRFSGPLRTTPDNLHRPGAGPAHSNGGIENPFSGTNNKKKPVCDWLETQLVAGVGIEPTAFRL